jgi:hypothetical protein
MLHISPFKLKFQIPILLSLVSCSETVHPESNQCHFSKTLDTQTHQITLKNPINYKKNYLVILVYEVSQHRFHITSYKNL